PNSAPSFSVMVASPLSAAVTSCMRPSGNVTLMVTTGAYVCAAASPLINRSIEETRNNLLVTGTSFQVWTLDDDIGRSLPTFRVEQSRTAAESANGKGSARLPKRSRFFV